MNVSITTKFLRAILKEPSSNPLLILWDSGDVVPDCRETICIWNGYSEKGSVRSLLRYLETHGDRLRQKYLKFIGALAETKVCGKRLVEHLNVGEDFSLWWMSLPAEMSPFKSPRVLDCLRLLALEEILLDQRPAGIRLVSADQDLVDAVRALCTNLNIHFEWQRTAQAKPKPLARRFYDCLPQSVQAIIYLLRYVVLRWPLRNCATPSWHLGDSSVLFLSYFFNLDQDQAARGQFHSRQWEALPGFLHRHGIRTNWIHHFVFSPNVPNTRTAAEWMARFNKQPGQPAVHSFLDGFLTPGLCFRVLGKWLRLIRSAPRARSIRRSFRAEGSAVSFWPLLRRDWENSVRGQTSMLSLLWIELFHAVMRSLPRQKLGIYLCENQGWEKAFIKAWRKYGHGALIAVPHSTIRFWHLSYHQDPRALKSVKSFPAPLPDMIALNGKAAHRAYIDPEGNTLPIVEVEALRYQYLDAVISAREGTAALPAESGPKRVLILGDFSVTQTERMLECVKKVALLSDLDLRFTVKLHSVCKIDLSPFQAMPLESTERLLSELVREFDVAFSSNSTSSCLDANLGGLPVVVFLDDSDFNMSPLRGVSGVRFVSNAEELSDALQTIEQVNNFPRADDFFWLDPDLPKWRTVLAENEVAL